MPPLRIISLLIYLMVQGLSYLQCRLMYLVNNVNTYHATIKDYLFTYLFDGASDYHIRSAVFYN